MHTCVSFGIRLTPVSRLVRQVLSFIEQNYPERAKRVFVLKGK